MRMLNRLALLVLAGALAACSDATGSEQLQSGRFEGNVSGGVIFSFTGDAYSTSTVISLVDPQDNYVVFQVAGPPSGTGLQARRYTFPMPAPRPTFRLVLADRREFAPLSVDSGFVQIDEVRANGISGEMDITMTELGALGPPPKVRIRTRFNTLYGSPP